MLPPRRLAAVRPASVAFTNRASRLGSRERLRVLPSGSETEEQFQPLPSVIRSDFR